MAFNPANHFVVSGAGIDGTIDLSSISGEGRWHLGACGNLGSITGGASVTTPHCGTCVGPPKP